ncbi:lipid transferase CIDEB [Athene noctua]|uniref:lipid transferase CIDEB n=1 Tax=Athene noctua TaxID=126797 RepID=UPI003EBA910C
MDVLRAVARRAWPPPAPQPRPFWVCDRRRGRPRGLVAASLEELREQARLFGEHWEPEPPRGRDPHPGDEVARVTVALARANPRDLVGQLRVTAAVRGLHCHVGAVGPERLLRELLRLLAAVTRAAGRGLLSLSGALRRLLDGPAGQRGAHGR